MRVLALDLGARRIGVAVSDADGRVATPVTVIERHRDRPRLHREIAGLVADYGAGLLLLGLPIDLAGAIGPAAAGVLAERDELAAVVGVPVEVHDERLTTRIADQVLRQRGDLDAKGRRKVVDMVAATVILQDWLDRARADAPAPVVPTAADPAAGGRAQADRRGSSATTCAGSGSHAEPIT